MQSVGVAVLVGTELEDWGVKSFKGPWSAAKQTKALKVLSLLIDRYQVNTLAIKCFDPSHASKGLTQFVSRLEHDARARGMRVNQYSLQELKLSLVPHQRITKRAIPRLVVSRYPFLVHALAKEDENYNPYYILMFEAVALAALGAQRASSRRL